MQPLGPLPPNRIALEALRTKQQILTRTKLEKRTMKKTNLLPLALMAAAALALPAASRAAISIGVENSPHDFSTNAAYASWNTRHGVCSPCHAAHNTDPAQVAPLW